MSNQPTSIRKPTDPAEPGGTGRPDGTPTPDLTALVEPGHRKHRSSTVRSISSTRATADEKR